MREERERERESCETELLERGVSVSCETELLEGGGSVRGIKSF